MRDKDLRRSFTHTVSPSRTMTAAATDHGIVSSKLKIYENRDTGHTSRDFGS